MSQSTDVKPRQLSYLKDLARQTGTTFVYPKTRQQASREIDRLIALKKNRDAPLPLETDTGQLGLGYATAVKPGEVSGYGSTASWRAAIEEGPAELTRYRVRGAERVLYGQRIADRVRITDEAADEAGRTYLVSFDLEDGDYSGVKGLVADYLAQADRFKVIPAADNPLRREAELEAHV
jgi:hypothetical protein